MYTIWNCILVIINEIKVSHLPSCAASQFRSACNSFCRPQVEPPTPQPPLPLCLTTTHFTEEKKNSFSSSLHAHIKGKILSTWHVAHTEAPDEVGHFGCNTGWVSHETWWLMWILEIFFIHSCDISWDLDFPSYDCFHSAVCGWGHFYREKHVMLQFKDW